MGSSGKGRCVSDGGCAILPRSAGVPLSPSIAIYGFVIDTPRMIVIKERRLKGFLQLMFYSS